MRWDMSNELIEERNQFYFLTLRLKGMLDKWQDFWFELKGHPTALGGGLIVLIYIFIAVFAPAIARMDRIRTFSTTGWRRRSGWKAPLPAIFSEAMSWEGSVYKNHLRHPDLAAGGSTQCYDLGGNRDHTGTDGRIFPGLV